MLHAYIYVKPRSLFQVIAMPLFKYIPYVKHDYFFLAVKPTLLLGLTIDSIVQNFGFFFQRHKLENLKQLLTWSICFRI